jgi:hypothetical protein
MTTGAAMASTDLEILKEYTSLVLVNPQMITPVALTSSMTHSSLLVSPHFSSQCFWMS